MRLRAFDAKTYRSWELDLGSAWDANTDPDQLARYLTAMATSVAKAWSRRYSVPFPTARVEWSVRRG